MGLEKGRKHDSDGRTVQARRFRGDQEVSGGYPRRVERNLEGRCGTCGYFFRLREEPDGSSVGECRLGCWPSPLRDSATCSSHKPKGLPFKPAAVGRGREPRAPRSLATRTDDAAPRIPKEIDLDMEADEFRDVLRQVLREELGIGDAPLGDRWKGGRIVIEPGKEGTQPRSIPIDAFFKKVVGIRDRLRVLEQKINANEALGPEDKLAMQAYVTQCYGSLTTFNALFRDRDDWFVGTGKDD